MAGLLFAQKVPGPAQIKVMRGQVEPRTQTVKASQKLQPFHRLRRQRAARFCCEITIGSRLRAANPAPNLVQLSKTEHIRPVHDHRVGGGNIQPRFHNRRGQQHVIFAVIELVHPIIQIARRQLAMGGDEGDLGHVGFQPILNLGQIGNPGHDPKALPTAVVFAQQRLAERHTIEFRDIGADRQTVDGGRRDDRQIAHPGQRKLQRARNGRGGQRQHMDVGPQLFQPLFVRHTKVLLFVDDQKAKVLKLHALRQKRMGADDDVHRPCPHHLPRQVGLFGTDKARQRSNRNREPPEAFGKAAVMLAGK